MRGGSGCEWGCASGGVRAASARPGSSTTATRGCGCTPPSTGNGAKLLPAAAPGDQGVVRPFLAAFAQEVGWAARGTGARRVGQHRADIPWPDTSSRSPCPRYSPELNPAEQVFRVLRPKLTNRIFATVAELEATITTHSNPIGTNPPCAAPHRLPLVAAAVTTLPQTP